MAHAMIGHSNYLDQYQRLNNEEKEERYEEVEPSILIFDQSKNKEKIHKLKEANKKFSDQQKQIDDNKIKLEKMEKKWMESSFPGISR